MSEAIRPALTPEEWSERLRRPEWASWWVLTSRAQQMALSNHALPDGHPLKITREDVEFLCKIRTESLEGLADQDYYCRGTIDCPDPEVLGRLADKLAALLPPA